MVLSITNNTYNPKRQSKKPHRRATVDTAPCFARSSSSKPERRLSLPLKKSVQFSQLSEVCVFNPPTDSNSSTRWNWYSGEDHQRFKRERISDVVSFREQARCKSRNNVSNNSSTANTATNTSVDASAAAASATTTTTTSNPASPGACCPVGLEQLLSTKGMLEAHSNRKIVIRTVLVEQHRQRTFGFRDPDQIALVSVRLSAEASEGAMKRGKFQEMAKFMD